MAGGSRPPPPPVAVITVINEDQNIRVTQADHLSRGESSAAPMVNTDPAHARSWRAH